MSLLSPCQTAIGAGQHDISRTSRSDAFLRLKQWTRADERTLRHRGYLPRVDRFTFANAAAGGLTPEASNSRAPTGALVPRHTPPMPVLPPMQGGQHILDSAHQHLICTMLQRSKSQYLVATKKLHRSVLQTNLKSRQGGSGCRPTPAACPPEGVQTTIGHACAATLEGAHKICSLW